jgi:hypothetical protein
MPRSKSKSKSKSKSSVRKYTKVLMDINECNQKTLKQIRKSRAYRNLIPFGVGKRRKANPNQKYHFGNKSTMRKAELCEALSNPKAYHKKLKKAYADGKKNNIKNTGPRKRYSRTGECRPYRRKPPCEAPTPYEGITTAATPCCYKKKQSEATKNKRLANKKKVLASKKKYNEKKSNQKSTRKPRSQSKK